MERWTDGMNILTSAVAAFFFLSAHALAGPPEGDWISQDGRARVHLSTCGAKRLCGRVVWLGEPNDPATGKPKTDKHNPDPAKRARPLIGLQVVHGLTPSGPNMWSGLVYNAGDGHMYSARVILQSDDVAKVEGCILDMLCREHTWMRVN
jgi:uncharacterized protein (DUF2147 family)